MGANNQENDDWCVECSDEEGYGASSNETGVWEPDPKVIVELYEKLAKGEKLELQWKCPGRRSPSPEKKDTEAEKAEETEEQPKEEEKMAPTEFDFDETVPEANPVTPRRTPGTTKTPRSAQHRVARMDNIMKDIMRHKKMGQEAKASRDRDRAAAAAAASASSPGETTPQRSPGKSRLSPKKL